MTQFSFGKNWEDYLKSLTPERFDIAKKSLQDFLSLNRFDQKTFLDIGSGSGVFSNAAYILGAEKIVSIDVDPFSVKCTHYLHEKIGTPENWSVLEGSVLDTNFMNTLGTFDIVYAWGSLHHTGSMYDAISNAAKRVAPAGLFVFALYNKVATRFGSTFWLKFKRFYNSAPTVIKRLVEWLYMGKLILYYVVNRKNPIKIIRNFKEKRGMSWKHDIIDWLGGYPYEFATVEEIFLFMKREFPDFQLENIKTTNGIGNNQFLFKRA